MNRRLHVVTCISNPVRYSSRYALFEKFKRHIETSPDAELYVVELAFGDRPHVVTLRDEIKHVQVRTSYELWHKENMLNLGIAQLPDDWEYVAWVDADVAFSRPDWALETIEQLQHYQVVQMFSHATDLSSRSEPGKTHSGFVHDWYHAPDKLIGNAYDMGAHSGYAWAARREALDSVGGLIDFGILGSADRHMACALLGIVERSYAVGVHPNYAALLNDWQERAERHIRRDVGYVPGLLMHGYHGPKAKRGYSSRWKVLVDHQFDPLRDIFRDTQGLWQLDDNKIELRDAIRKYFRQRHEDENADHADKLIA